MTIVLYLLLFVLLLLPGVACWLIWGESLKSHMRGLEIIFLIMLVGVGFVSWVALTLAEFEQFSLPLLAGIVIVASMLVGARGIKNGRFLTAFRELSWEWPSLMALLFLGVSAVVSPPPFEYVVGGRDHGVYVNTGVHIARTGGILVYDEALAAVPPELRDVLIRPETRLWQSGFPGPWSDGIRLTGLTIRDKDAGVMLPHAFHLFPALIAVFYAVGGIKLALFTNLFLGMLGSVAIYLVGRRLFGPVVGLLTLFLLLLSVSQMWYMRYPSAEMLLQPLFWGGLLTAVFTLEQENRLTAVLTGVCFGLMHLAKMDTVLIPVLLFIFLIHLWVQQRLRPVFRWLLVPYLLLSIQAVLHGVFIATIYFLDQSIRVLFPEFMAEKAIEAVAGVTDPQEVVTRLFAANWQVLSAVLLVGGVLVWLLRIAQPRITETMLRLSQRRQLIRKSAVVGMGGMVLLTAVVGTVGEINTFGTAFWSLHLTQLYMTRLGMFLGIVGIFYLIYTIQTETERFVMLMVLGNVLPFYVLGSGTAGDHFWVIRRFVTITFPLFFMGIATLIWVARPRSQKWWPVSVVPLGILGVMVLGLWQHTGPMLQARDYQGMSTQLQQLNETFPEDAVLLMMNGNQAQRLNLPLWIQFDKTVFTIREEVVDDPLLQTAVSFWVSQGRPVYWLAVNGNKAPAWSGWNANFSHTFTVDTPLVETPLGRIPKETGTYHVQFDVYQLLPQTASLLAEIPDDE